MEGFGLRLPKIVYIGIWLLAALSVVLLQNCSLFEGRLGARFPWEDSASGPGKEARTLSADWVQSAAGDFRSGTGEGVGITDGGAITLSREAGKLSASGTYTSTVKESSFPFNAVGVQWGADVPTGTEVIGEIRTSADGTSFTDWKQVATGADAEDQGGDGIYIAELVFVSKHRWMQYRLTLRTHDPDFSPSVREVKVTFIDSTQGPNPLEDKSFVAKALAAGQPTIITRSQWGADESLRFKNNEEIWPPVRRPVQKFIIHHTVTQNADPDPPATIRAIYRYHASTLGWGDIGYNYLIDSKGNIYEGRYGGDDVASGHAKQYNYGSMGIAVLGNYDAAGVTGSTKDALVSLITAKALRFGIDPNGSSFLLDKEFPNIAGHLEVLPTTCPGDLLEKQIPDIRAKVTSQIPAYGVAWESHSTPSSMQPGQTVKVKVSLVNRGRKTWQALGGARFRLGYHWYQADGTPVKQPPADDKRTELPRDVAFGQTVSLDALLTAPEQEGTYILKWDVVQEGVTWLANQGAAPLEMKIQVGPAGTPQSVWYFAEGSTMRGYSTAYQLMNPGSEPANVAFAFMNENGNVYTYTTVLKPTSRSTVDVNGIIPNANISTKIESDRRIYAERTMVFGHDGHTSSGTANPSSTWYFAEGATAWGYGTWLLLMNPNDSEAKAVITFYRENGPPVTKEYRLKPTSRLNVFANKEIPNANVGTKIESDRPIVAERSMYMDGGKGGHGSMGATETAKTWLFAEGFTNSDVQTWLLLMNPNESGANVTVTFYRESGAEVVKTFSLSPSSRFNIYVNRLVPSGAVGTKVESDVPIVAERSMYFTGGKGAHNSVGANKGSKTWYLPEGYTGPGVAEWLLFLNPEPGQANVNLTFMKSDGTTSAMSLTIPSLSRYTLYLNSVIPNAELSTKVEASGPIVVERALYFSEGLGGTASLGIPGDQ